MASYDKYGFDPSKQKADMSALEDRIAALESRSFSIKNIFPVGYVLISVADINPNTLFPGTTWVRLTGSHMLVSYDNTNINFNAGGKEGGSWSHKHTINGTALSTSQIPSHNHGVGSHEHTLVYDQYSQNGLTNEQWNGGTNISGFKDDRRVFTEYTESPSGAHWRATWRLNGSDNDFGKLNITRVTEAGHSVYAGSLRSDGYKTGSTGGSAQHTHGCENATHLPPYITCHMWKRTA